MIERDAIGAQPLACRLVEHTVELASVYAEFGMGIAGVAPARLAVDELPVAIEEEALLVLDRHRAQSLLQAERRELAHRVGQERDADAELLDLRRTFEYAAGEPARVQREREREARDPAAADENPHRQLAPDAPGLHDLRPAPAAVSHTA